MKPRLAAAALAAALASLTAPAPGHPAAADSAATSPAAGEGAAAWVLRLDTPAGPALHLADTTARLGPAAGAEAAPVVVAGTVPVRATADPAHPDEKVVATPLHWADPSGSLTLEGAVAEAQASSRSATARAGFGTAGGTGFALADKLFTWEQQERLLAQVAALDAAVFDPLNARLAALTPVLAAAGLKPPHFEALSPIGLVDTGRGTLAAASAEVASGGSFTSGRAEASLDQIRLLGGFIDARRLSVEAVSERSAESTNRRHGVWIGQLSVAGVAVVADGDDIRVAGNDVASRTLVQPALDLLLDALAEHGVELQVGAARELPGGSEASALQLSVTAPAGRFAISLAAARAEAPPVTPAAAPGGRGGLPSAGTSDAPVATGPLPPPVASNHDRPRGGTTPLAAPSLPESDEPADRSGFAEVEESAAAPAAPPDDAGTAVAGPEAHRPLGAFTTARSLRAVYLLLIVAGIAGALALPALVVPVTGRPAPRRRRP